MTIPPSEPACARLCRKSSFPSGPRTSISIEARSRPFAASIRRPLSKEDAETHRALYAAERKREQLQASVGSIDEWLLRLGLNVRVEPLGQANLTRTTQLLNKTNQMNLSTRRLTESELSGWAEGSGRSLWAVQVEDRFGDAGLTGIVSVEVSQTVATIVDFVLSCRVMGRKIEQAMVHVAVEHARGMRGPTGWRPTLCQRPRTCAVPGLLAGFWFST
jgi:FkbH-like protein